MGKIECYLLGTPEIKEDGKNIYIPMGKVSGILYYLLIKKHSNRDELVSIFWPSSNESRAKTSLRNALHKIKKAFSEDLILTPNKSSLIINEELDIFIDADKFDEDPINNNSLYTDDFLKGFNVKDSIGFEDWIIETRSYYKNKFISNIEETIIKKYKNNELTNLENDIYRLLNADNFNENAYYYLMKKFEAFGRYDKVVNEYHKYRNLLKEELGVAPSEQIEDVYKRSTMKIKENTKDKRPTETDYLYYREYEQKVIQENLNSFKNSEPYKSILITGEYGIGKSVLINKVINNNATDFKTFKIQCSSVEKNFTYSPWIKLVRQIDEELKDNNLTKPKFWDEVLNNVFYDGDKDLRPSVQIFEFEEKVNRNLLHNSLLNIFEILNKEKKIVIIIEDIQWMDKFSKNLLNNLILHINSNVIFILSMSESTDLNLNNDFTALIDLKKLMYLKLKLFDKNEVATIIKKSIDREIPEKDIDYMYKMSKGNAFFLNVYIDLYKNNEDEDFLIERINNVLYEKFDDLTELEQSVLSILAVYNDEMSIDFLTKSLNTEPFKILKAINNLVRRKIVDEKKVEDQISIVFSYDAYKEYVYKKLNNSTKQILHREVAKSFESVLLTDGAQITSYIKLRYHYSRSNEAVKSLKYEVYILNYYLNFNHELYPSLNNFEDNDKLDYLLNDDKSLKWIEDMELEILRVKNTCTTTQNKNEIEEIELTFLYCKGRYFIRCGNYNEGTRVMRRVISYANDMNNDSMELAGHKQMIIYGIQINDTNTMINHIIPGIKVAKKLKNNQEQGVLYRLYGLYHIMRGDFESAEKLLKSSLDMFSNSAFVESNNPISIAAVYNYLGEIRNAEFKFDEAMEFYNKAIDLCEGVEASCLAIFYINAGKTSFLTGNYNEMKKYLLLARKIVKQFDSYWKTPVLEALTSLMLFLEGKYEETVQYLQLANTQSNIINNPRDKGMIDFVSAIIASEINNRRESKYEGLKKYLNNEPQVYYYNSMKHLDRDRDRAEIRYLKKVVLEDREC